MRQISKCLNSNLTKIYKQSLIIDILNKSIYKYLPKELHSYIKVASFYQGRLLLVTTNASISSEVRFLIPELMEKLRKERELPGLTGIKIKVVAKELKPKPIIEKKSISKDSRSLINEVADKCSYLPLKNALEKLAKIK